jgi:DNA repair exonuclease SbcCD ATPase subunit
MLKLKSYSFSGIGRFVEKQTVDLDSRSHLIQIDGENTNTGGSSGAGKSTTVEALAFLLGISDIPSTQLQSRITKSPIWVQGEFEGGITITRSKKDGLTVETTDGIVSGNSQLAEERLDEIIGVDRKLLKTMCYKRQKQGGFFLNLTPKESHEFLVECLDLRQYQDKINTMNEIIKEQYKPRKIELTSALFEIENTVSQLEDYLKQKEKPVEPVFLTNENEINSNISVLEQAMYGENQKYKDSVACLGSKPEIIESEGKYLLQGQLDNIGAEILHVKNKMWENDNQREKDIEQMTSALYKVQKKVDDAHNMKLKAIEKEETVKGLREQHNHIEAGSCPTCQQNWTSKESLLELQLAIADINSEIDMHKEEVVKIPHYLQIKEKAETMLKNKRVNPINLEETKILSDLEEKKTNLVQQANDLDKHHLQALNDYNQKEFTITSLHKERENEIMAEITRFQTDLTQMATIKKSYDDALEAYGRDCEKVKEKVDGFFKEIASKKEELMQIERNVLLSEESIRLIKNYTLRKFQDTLDYVGHRASEIINMIPNMSNSIISFENAKQTKTGSIKNEVNAVINLEGDIKVPIKTLSGGERTSADFAVDLAIGEMIETMTQKGVNFLIIDEGFDGLDSISKIECLEILKTLNTNKKILMVDHSSEVKEMVHDIIRVKRTNEESVIV